MVNSPFFESFDPGPAPAAGMENRVPRLRVSQINEAANVLLGEAFPRVLVEGEISNWVRAASGHIYFALKEGEEALLNCAMWRSQAMRLPVGANFGNGMAVVAAGRLGVYPKSGKFQLYAEQLFVEGVGAAEEALRRLREKLAKLGYFAPERKRTLPPFPRRVAVVTSGTGAAIRDVLAVLSQQAPQIEVVIVAVRVQGAGAAGEIAAALDRLGHLHETGRLPLDAVIVGRGGGSNEDLYSFNDAAVARAIYESAVPVISAVGHEVDVLISDQVADVRAATPTHAAEMLADEWARLPRRLAEWRGRLPAALAALAGQSRQRLDNLAQRRVFRFPLEKLRERQQRVDDLDVRFQAAITRLLERLRSLVAAGAGRLQALSPLNVLARGYSLTQTGDRVIVRDAAQVGAGEIIVTRLHHGRLTSKVISIETDEPT